MAEGGPDRKLVETLIKRENPQLLPNLSSTKRNQLLDAVSGVLQQQIEITATQITHRSGPLPSPEEMLEYNTAVPDGATRILAMAEKQQDHRIKLETFVVNQQQTQSGRGQIIGAILVVAALASGIGVTAMGAFAVAGVIFGTTVLGVGGLYAAGRVSQARSLKNKSEKQ